MPIDATAAFGFEAVPALKKASDIDSSDPNDPVPHVITVAMGSINPLFALPTSALV